MATAEYNATDRMYLQNIDFHVEDAANDIDGMAYDVSIISDWLQNDLYLLLANMTPGGTNDLASQLSEIAQSLTNMLDKMAYDNPWWATNSAFVTQKNYINNAIPSEYPESLDTFSFPQFMSLWGAKLNQPGGFTTAQFRDNWWTWWGADSVTKWWPDKAGRKPMYTWFDWITDYARSNMTLQVPYIVEGGTNELAEWSEEYGASHVVQDEDRLLSTNPVMPSWLEPISNLNLRTPTQFEALLDIDFDSMEDWLTEEETPYMTVVPSLTLGHVTTPTLSFNWNGIPTIHRQYVRGFCVFLWLVLAGVATINLARNEYTYWTTLGNAEGGS